VEPISVLIVDDSALMRNLIGKIVDGAEGLDVAGKAMNGLFALQKIPKLNPDVILLDLEMPQMNGITFLKERKKEGIEIPVIILSSIARKGAAVTMEALSLGASDFIMKPSGSISEDIGKVSEQIVNLLKVYGGKYAKRKGKEPPKLSEIPTYTPPRPAKPAASGAAPSAAPSAPAVREGFVPVDTSVKPTGPIRVVAVGISTGGPNALRKVFANLDSNLKVPILVVQHMPPGFTEEFAKSLDRICPLEVKEAEEGDVLKAGRVFIAPGSHHITVENRRLASVVRLSDAEPRNGHRPSADILYESIREQYGGEALAVIMTGMGKDGARELGKLKNAGAFTLGQDEATSVVYGMPKVAFEHGYVGEQVPLSQIAERINDLVKEHGA
jgi:two-component system chemotaxis response regulator CheB